MQIHTISAKTKRPHGKRVGRGGKRGTFSGRGQNGQRARAGHRIRPAERDLLQRLPKLRGFKNKVKSDVATALRVGSLARLAKDGKINAKILLAGGISGRVKILDGGNIKVAVVIEKIAVSAGAKKKIEAAGGKIV
jgi:large subunit ribosomal protein L15